MNPDYCTCNDFEKAFGYNNNLSILSFMFIASLVGNEEDEHARHPLM